MRAITEQLYLQRGNNQRTKPAPTTSLAMSANIEPGTLLIEFYRDARLWAFIIDGQTIDVRCLPVAIETRFIYWLSCMPMSAALKIDSQSSAARSLTQLRGVFCSACIFCLSSRWRLTAMAAAAMIVPYGACIICLSLAL
jgi:hypothetical protein